MSLQHPTGNRIQKLTLSTAEQPVAGDINGDGKTDLADLLLLQRYLLGSGVLQADQAKAQIFSRTAVSADSIGTAAANDRGSGPWN
ncbi:MAG: dockerin type I domain-containing protein [Ruminococcus callidus]